jgi:hypothetical protein
MVTGRVLSVEEAIDFWLDFLAQIGVAPDYVTIHPDRLAEWTRFYRNRLPIRPDLECTWSDGNITGYSTEFYKGGIEIGNIVNPLGTCIDVGFGLDSNTWKTAGAAAGASVWVGCTEPHKSRNRPSGYRQHGLEQAKSRGSRNPMQHDISVAQCGAAVRQSPRQKPARLTTLND